MCTTGTEEIFGKLRSVGKVAVYLGDICFHQGGNMGEKEDKITKDEWVVVKVTAGGTVS